MLLLFYLPIYLFLYRIHVNDQKCLFCYFPSSFFFECRSYKEETNSNKSPTHTWYDFKERERECEREINKNTFARSRAVLSEAM